MHAQPFLTFQPSRGQRAAEAMALYCDVFGDAEVLSEQFWGTDGPGGEAAARTVMTAEFRIGDLRVRCSDSPVQHAWDFSPAQSLWVEFADATEHQRVFDALVDGGQVFMPVGDYGFGTFGWVAERFGVNWQLVVVGE